MKDPDSSEKELPPSLQRFVSPQGKREGEELRRINRELIEKAERHSPRPNGS
jgi:hypothetical protein